jgi:hypothetical protein
MTIAALSSENRHTYQWLVQKHGKASPGQSTHR